MKVDEKRCGIFKIVKIRNTATLKERFTGTIRQEWVAELSDPMNGEKCTRFQQLQDALVEYLDRDATVNIQFPTYTWGSKFLYSTQRWFWLRKGDGRIANDISDPIGSIRKRMVTFAFSKQRRP